MSAQLRMRWCRYCQAPTRTGKWCNDSCLKADAKRRRMTPRALFISSLSEAH